MSSSPSSPASKGSRKSLWTHLIAGGGAGLVESCTCHPLDTVKVRMQLSSEGILKTNDGVSRILKPKKLGPFGTFFSIVRNEGVLALYKGLGPVVSAIVPKMAIRFTSFEAFKDFLGAPSSTTKTFFGKRNFIYLWIAGLGAGVVESVVVMNPMEVIKIRLQAQRSGIARYHSATHAAFTILKEEGPLAFYRGVSLTAARQGEFGSLFVATNQAVNFTLYQEFKKILSSIQNDADKLPSWQHLLCGGVSGAIAPCVNAPIDIIKTRIQRQINTTNGLSGFSQIKVTAYNVYAKEGILGFYRGLTPRLMRIAPGQAITFMVYEKIQNLIISYSHEHWPEMVLQPSPQPEIILRPSDPGRS